MLPGEHSLLLELFLIFVWAKMFGEIFEHLKLPSVLGEILAGVLLGPHLFALIEPGKFTDSIAELGAVFLLFSVGLETLPGELIRVGRQALVVALAGVALPFLLGFAYIKLQGGTPQEATFVAAAMVATSVGITARVLGDMKVLETRAARIVLGAAVFDDILGMLLLAVVVGLASVGTIRWLQLGFVAVEAVGFALFMIFVAPRLIRRIRPRIEEISLKHAPLVLALSICLGLSVAAEEIGMAAIIGAFFAGLAFAEYAPAWNLKPPVQGTTEFLAPFFFFIIGTRLDLHVFQSPDLLLVAGVVALLAVASKLVGCGGPVLREGWQTALQVGVGMVPRGEVGLIVALLGLQMQLISPSTYAVVVFMTAATTLVSPPLLRVLFKPTDEERRARVAGTFSRRNLRVLLSSVVGLLFCSGLAALGTALFSSKSWRSFIPLAFILVIILAAVLFGRAAGIFGSLAAALIFAIFLFKPIGSWTVAENAARVNIGWMLLAGIALSYFAARSHEKPRRA